MWMNIYKPIIGELTEENDIHASIELYKENGTIIENRIITKLEEIDLNAEQKVKNIINNMAKKDDIPVYYDGKIEQLEWVKLMNNYKNIAEEIVNNELIFC